MTARAFRAVRHRLRLLRDRALDPALRIYRVSRGELVQSLRSDRRDAARRARGARPERFFFDEEEIQDLAERFKALYPEEVKSIIACAEQALDREFARTCAKEGGGERRMNWAADPTSGHAWQMLPSGILALTVKDGVSEVKHVWELSRCHHFARLGEAYALTGDERYPEGWALQMQSWDRGNPPLMGPNWMVAMEAAIRIVNWIWGWAFMSGSQAFDAHAREVFYRNLLCHGRFVARHMEAYGNHRFSDLVGLLFLGVLFDEFREASDWRRTATEGLLRECRLQVRADGAHFEGSIAYHRLVLEMLASSWLLMRRNGMEIPAEMT